MLEPASYTYPRYLSAKESVDERSLNRRVWSRFVEELCTRSSPLRILEVGGGIGTTVERVVDTLENREVGSIEYTLVDVESQNVDAARERLLSWSDERTREGSAGQVSIRYETADLFDFATAEDESYDAIIAQAVLDLLSVPEVLNALRPLLATNGLWYLPIHFDGVTAFEPLIDPDLDSRIQRLYHASMTAEEHERDGPHTGRRLLTRLREQSATLIDAGSSDWVVFADNEGYSDDEAYFLQHILHFIEEELSGHPELESDAFADWLEKRRRQINTGELIYVAHQLDVLARQG